MKLNFKQYFNFNWTKIALTLILISIVTVFLGLIYLNNYFNHNRLKRIVIPKLERALQREVQIGDITLKYWQGLGIRLSDVRLGNSSQFSNEHLMKVKNLTLDIALLPLLQRQLKVNQIRLLEPIIYLERTADGKANYTSTTADQKKSSKQPVAEDTFLLTMDQIEIIDGQIKYSNQQQDWQVDLKGLNSQSSARLENNKFTTTSSLELNNLSFYAAEEQLLNLTNLNSNFTVDASQEELIVEQLRSNLADSVIELSGQVVNLSTQP
ncbi:MAG: AsmA family protein, partial [Bacillota bacterium]